VACAGTASTNGTTALALGSIETESARVIHVPASTDVLSAGSMENRPESVKYPSAADSANVAR